MVRIERATRLDQVEAATHLLDGPVSVAAAGRFLGEPGHHLLLAYDEASTPVGFVAGVETTHPDKGTEMLLYELAVDEDSRGRGVGTALVEALAALARDRGCYGMWVLTDHDNVAALATYRAAAGAPATTHAMVTWSFGATTAEQAGGLSP